MVFRAVKREARNLSVSFCHVCCERFTVLHRRSHVGMAQWFLLHAYARTDRI